MFTSFQSAAHGRAGGIRRGNSSRESRSSSSAARRKSLALREPRERGRDEARARGRYETRSLPAHRDYEYYMFYIYIGKSHANGAWNERRKHVLAADARTGARRRRRRVSAIYSVVRALPTRYVRVHQDHRRICEKSRPRAKQ